MNLPLIIAVTWIGKEYRLKYRYVSLFLVDRENRS
jgi:hypothetical protein